MRRMIWALVALFALGGAAALTRLAAAHDVPAVPGERPAAVFLGFPLRAEAYQAPVAALVREGVPDKYGHEEWISVSLTHEFHQHVGIYTVLGAKMAVRAREVMNAPMRAVRVTAETGRAQPLACFIDGLQVGLGSTMGQNLIEAPEMDAPRVAASFEYNGMRLRLALKDEYRGRIAAIIQDARTKHGDLTPEYFMAVEEASYRVWAEFDRRQIFAVTGTVEG